MDFREISISDLHAAVALGKLSFREIAQACCDRIRQLEPELQAWVRYDEKNLLHRAEEADARLKSGQPMRRLEGIPVGVKDVYNTVDFPTEMGSPLWKDFTPGNDARTVYHLKKEGALLAGKTTTAEFAVHALISGTVNPHGKEYTPGTSSSGSAVAIASGMVPVALGTQTAGSIIRPASFCGIYGFKPSFGTIPRTGVLKTTDSLDTLGFFTARLSDFTRVYDTLRVHGHNYPYIQNILENPSVRNKPESMPWRVAFVKTHTWETTPDYAKQAIEKKIQELSKVPGFEVRERELGPIMEESHHIHATIYDKALAYYFQEEYRHVERISPVMQRIIDRGNRIAGEDYQKAVRRQEVLAREMTAFFDESDVLLCLSTAGSAPLRDVEELPDPSLMWTMTHLPSVNIPLFRCPKGMPFGLQAVSKRYHDFRLNSFVEDLVKKGLAPEGVNPKVA